MDSGGKRLIFGRYSRDECGLPPVFSPAAARRALLLRTLALLVLLVLAGWIAGVGVARWRALWLTGLPAMVRSAGPERVSDLLAKGGAYARALADHPEAAGSLIAAGAVAAENAPRRLGYYGNLANLCEQAAPERLAPVDFVGELTASGIFFELGEYDKAFLRLDRAEAVLQRIPDEAARRSLRLLLVNSQAYYLAVAPEGSGRNADKSLHLAQLMISSRDALPGGDSASGSAALLDTLALAWHVAGDSRRALASQTLALGLAESVGLEEYIKHYDEFAAAANPDPVLFKR